MEIKRYAAASEGLPVLPAVGEAVEWANALVQRIAPRPELNLDSRTKSGVWGWKCAKRLSVKK